MSQFTKVPVAGIPTNTFDLSHTHRTTMDGGYIYPIQCVEALPKDRFTYDNSILARLAPMVSPAMTNIDITTITGFVPIRLIWDSYERYFSNPVPDGETPVPPHFENKVIDVGSLGDYLGLPTQKVYDEATGSTFDQYSNDGIDWFSALPYAAYQKFFSDWFRDENLYNLGQDIPWKVTDGVNNWSWFNVLRKRAWRHDYFTSNLPFAQKGDPVEIPIANFTDVPVIFDNNGNKQYVKTDMGTPFNPGFQYSGINVNGASPTATGDFAFGQNNAYTGEAWLDPNGTFIAETGQLSSAAAVTVNTLRWAEKLQVFLEKNARGGTRYTEIVRQHFGVTSSDARLQRAEFLGFSVNPITISEVLQNSASQEGSTPLGEMGGHGISYGRGKHINYFAEEHGFFITFASIRPQSSYSQGLTRMWTRKSPLDYAWPTFAQLGEQETKNKEIYYQRDADGTGLVENELTFGYLPRYAEMRYVEDRISGEMRTSYAYWHQSRIFKELPALNEDFISCTPTKRIFNITLETSQPYILQIRHNLRVRRALPKYGIPAL